MKFICKSEDFSSSITIVSKYASTKSTNPILENVFIQAQDNFVCLKATDGLLSIEKKFEAKVEDCGELICDGRFLADYCKKMTDGTIEFDTDNSNTLKIKYLDSVGKVKCLDINEFPKDQPFEDCDFVEMKQCDLKDIISKTIFSSADDDTRPILKGCLFAVRENTIRSVALDGYRLAVAKANIENKSKDVSIVIPSKTLCEIYKLLENSDDPIKLYINNYYINIIVGGYNITSRLLSGDFIAYQNVIPKEFETNIVVNREQLELALERTAILSRFSTNNLVKFEIDDDVLSISSQAEQGSIKEVLNVEHAGKSPLTISFNSRYLIEALKATSDEFIILKFLDPTKPCVINAAENGNYLFLILPVRTL